MRERKRDRQIETERQRSYKTDNKRKRFKKKKKKKLTSLNELFVLTVVEKSILFLRFQTKNYNLEKATTFE